ERLSTPRRRRHLHHPPRRPEQLEEARSRNQRHIGEGVSDGCSGVGHDAHVRTPRGIQPARWIHPKHAMRAPPPNADPARMPANKGATGGSGRRCYEIRVRGPIGPTIMQAFPTLTATRSGHDTLLTGSLADQSALYGVINQLETLGLQLLEIRHPKP